MLNKIENQNGKMGTILPSKHSKEPCKAAKLYAYFTSLYPLYRRETDDGDKAKAEIAKWTEGIENLTDLEIRKGCEWCRDHEQYAPTIARFKFKALGLVDSAIAFDVACADHECAPIRNAFQKLTSYDWKYVDDEKRRRKFLGFYALACQDIIDGKEIDAPFPVMIEKKEAPLAVPLSPEQKSQKKKYAEECLKQMRDSIGSSQIKKGLPYEAHP